MSQIVTHANPDLEILAGNKSRCTHADHRRRGFHNLYRLARYSIGLRAARVMPLEKRVDLRIARDEGVSRLLALPWFSAVLVVRGQDILFEHYASDFSKDHPHSIQSITKTTLNLIIGQLLDQGLLDLSRPVADYIPTIGSGYAHASLQQVLNMDVVNDYSEDFADPQAAYYRHEEAMGWRLPLDPEHEETQRSFLVKIESADTTNITGRMQYKDANTDVLGWIAERASGRPLRAFLADIVDAAGLEGVFHITTDREGVPSVDGGACLTARDLARYLSLFVRRGRGISGQVVGSSSFIEQTLSGGIAMSGPYDDMRYSNQTMVRRGCIGHSGWGGQYAVANLETGVLAVFFSVLETEHAINRDFIGPVIRTLHDLTLLSA